MPFKPWPLTFRRRQLIAAGAGALLASKAQAQAAYPNRPITLIVPFPPGGSVDIAGRLIGEPLSKLLGQPIVIDNRAGAGGSVGTAYAAKAAADGYTLIVASLSTHVANPAMQPQLNYDPVRDFAPITLINRVSNVLVVHPSVPAKTFAEFVAYAKAYPGKLNFATPGNGSLSHLTMEFVKAHLGLHLTHIPYRGGGPAMSDLLSGQVQVMWDNLSPQLAHVQAGKLRALAVTGPQRTPQLPDVPTFAELKLPALNLSSWSGLEAPAGTPKPIIDKIYNALIAILREPATRELWHAKGLMVPEPLKPEAFAQEMQERINLYKAIVRDNHISIDG